MKEFTVSSGCPYARNADASPFCASSSVRRCRFMSSPRNNSMVVGWRLFVASHRTNMSQAGQRGWGGVTFLHNKYRVPHMVVHQVNLEFGVHLRPPPASLHWASHLPGCPRKGYPLYSGGWGGWGGHPLRSPSSPMLGLMV